MRIDQYKLQTGVMRCGKAHASIAREAGIEPSEFRGIMLSGRCNRNQRNSIAAAIDMDPHDLTLWEE